MLPLTFALMASVFGDVAPASPAEPPATARAAVALAPDEPSGGDSLLWRSAAVAGGALCGMTACGAAPVAGGALALSGALTNVDPIAGYAIGFCCGAAMMPVPGICGALFAGGAGVIAELLAGLTIDWGALAWSAGAAAMIGVGLGALAFLVAFPIGLVMNEAGQRTVANIVYGGVPLVVITGGALLASAAAGGLYFLSGSAPDETVVDASAWTPTH